MKFQNRQFGASPGADARLFTPITIAGRSSFSDVVLFYAVSSRIIRRADRLGQAAAAVRNKDERQ